MEIHELGTTEKKMYGGGIEHSIFPSRSNPNVVFKVGHKDTVDEWFEVFRSNPEVFPKVFRAGKLKSEDIYYVELEKLDTNKFEDKWDDLELALEDIGALDVDRGESFTDLYSHEGTSSQKFKEIGLNLVKHDRNSYDFFIELLNVIKKAEKAQLSITGKDTLVDAHKYNFGYSLDGKLKCLDI